MEKRPLSEVIQSDRVILKKHDLSLADLMFQYVDQDRARLRQYLPWVDVMKSAEDERGYIQFTQKNWEQCAEFSFGIFQKDAGAYVGNIEIRCNANNARSADVPRRLGYQHEGTLRQDAIEHGVFRDTMVFGKVASEWSDLILSFSLPFRFWSSCRSCGGRVE